MQETGAKASFKGPSWGGCEFVHDQRLTVKWPTCLLPTSVERSKPLWSAPRCSRMLLDPFAGSIHADFVAAMQTSLSTPLERSKPTRSLGMTRLALKVLEAVSLVQSHPLSTWSYGLGDCYISRVQIRSNLRSIS